MSNYVWFGIAVITAIIITKIISKSLDIADRENQSNVGGGGGPGGSDDSSSQDLEK